MKPMNDKTFCTYTMRKTNKHTSVPTNEWTSKSTERIEESLHKVSSVSCFQLNHLLKQQSKAVAAAAGALLLSCLVFPCCCCSCCCRTLAKSAQPRKNDKYGRIWGVEKGTKRIFKLHASIKGFSPSILLTFFCVFFSWLCHLNAAAVVAITVSLVLSYLSSVSS